MKKYILLFTLLYSTISFADLYLKAEINTHHNDKGVGAGYRFNDTYRADLMYNLSSFKSNNNYIAYEEIIDDYSTTGTKRTKYKTDIKYILFNNYLNIINKENYSIFVSGSIGYAKIRENITELLSGIMINGQIISIPLEVEKH